MKTPDIIIGFCLGIVVGAGSYAYAVRSPTQPGASASAIFSGYTITAHRDSEGYDNYSVSGPDCYGASFPYRNHAESFIDECKTKQRVWYR